MLDSDGKGQAELDNRLLLDDGLGLVTRPLSWILDRLRLEGVGACVLSVTSVVKVAKATPLHTAWTYNGSKLCAPSCGWQ